MSHDRWRWLPNAAKGVLRQFSCIFAQDTSTATFLRRLGAKHETLHVIGSLKESSGALPHDEAERLHFVDLLKTRPGLFGWRPPPIPARRRSPPMRI